jgi:hypothetical protein
VAPPVLDALGVPGALVAAAVGVEKPTAIRRWRQRRQVRRTRLLEAKLAARENLRDFNPWKNSDAGGSY